MSESNKTYRIRTNINSDKVVQLPLFQDYETFEILSLKIGIEDVYKLHTSKYGCIAGRVLANDAFGIPNAKVSVFVPRDENDDNIISSLYPYKSVFTKNEDGVRYNLFPDEPQYECHKEIGTFPDKRKLLDNDVVVEVFEKYYKYTSSTNSSGDYMIFGVPVGNQTVHVDIDLSDIGILSQRPIDLMYKGYNLDLFENPSQFKQSTNLDGLAQVISQNFSINVNPFWGEDIDNTVSITRNDMNIDYHFEPTCIFIGSLITDNESEGISKRCIPSERMGKMDKMVAGEGLIEMIRIKNERKIKITDASGITHDVLDVENFSIKGNRLIDGNGTWCYQIPMNLDYMGTDEFGNMVPTNDPNKGIPTRTSVRFRISMVNDGSDFSVNHFPRVLIPNNPTSDTVDYNFGTFTSEDSFRDLFYNNVYTIKSFIPRLQWNRSIRNKKFTGIKGVNINGGNNQLPYNNLRVNLSFMFVLQCAIMKALILIVSIYNRYILRLQQFMKSTSCEDVKIIKYEYEGDDRYKNIGTGTTKEFKTATSCILVGDGMCPEMENYYFAPGCNKGYMDTTARNIINAPFKLKDGETLEEGEYYRISGDTSEGIRQQDGTSIDTKNKDTVEEYYLTNKLTRLIQCVEINLAMEYEVINFDFYNDWINGTVYLPRWYATLRKSKRRGEEILGCIEGHSKRNLKYVEQCALTYQKNKEGYYTEITTPDGCNENGKLKCHTKDGRQFVRFSNLSLVKQIPSFNGNFVYYMKPGNGGAHLFATDIVLLGSIDSCNRYGIPNAFNDIPGTSYQMPPTIAAVTEVIESENGSEGYTYSYKNGNTGNTVAFSGQTIVYDENDILIDGYDVSDIEISGIDWGYEPNKERQKNDKNLRQYGGHFLGISCANSQTNVKTCVNLERMCEVGVSPSQKLSLSTNEYYYARGAVGNMEVNDTNFRNIFASLNSNHLKTVVDKETGYKMYEFIPVLVDGFDGKLKNKIQTREKELLYGEKEYYPIENNVHDYYKFRRGIFFKENGKNSNVNNEGNILSKYDDNYLIKNKDENNKIVSVALPVYDNSFYFYFGIKNGSTAYDRFLHDYYSKCSKDDDITNMLVKEVFEQGEGNKEFTISKSIGFKPNNMKVSCGKFTTVTLEYEDNMTNITLSGACAINNLYVTFENSIDEGEYNNSAQSKYDEYQYYCHIFNEDNVFIAEITASGNTIHESGSILYNLIKNIKFKRIKNSDNNKYIEIEFTPDCIYGGFKYEFGYTKKNEDTNVSINPYDPWYIVDGNESDGNEEKENVYTIIFSKQLKSWEDVWGDDVSKITKKSVWYDEKNPYSTVGWRAWDIRISDDNEDVLALQVYLRGDIRGENSMLYFIRDIEEDKDKVQVVTYNRYNILKYKEIRTFLFDLVYWYSDSDEEQVIKNAIVIDVSFNFN